MGTGGEGDQGGKGAKYKYCILGFRVPTTSVGVRRGQRGVKGSKAYCILGFRVSTTSVRARGEGAKGSEGSEESIGGG